MYHVEMRQFPHNFCRFNLSERELHETVLDAWAREQWLEFGERRWNPHEATLTVLEGPRLAVQDLSMGRGWRNAQRRGEDVTERILASRRAALAAAPGAARAAEGQDALPTDALPTDALPTDALATTASATAAAASPEREPLALAVGLISLLGEDPTSLIQAWRLALERHPDRSPSDCLALAEDLVRR